MNSIIWTSFKAANADQATSPMDSALKLEDFAVEFYPNCYFGCYPTQTALQVLEESQFDLVVKLTCEPEKNIHPYQTFIEKMAYPIKDNSIPLDWESFSVFISKLLHLYILKNKKIFIHCKGGHGRSCIIVACLLYCLKSSSNARIAIEDTIQIHNKRQDLSSRWRNIRSPFSKTQYIFLYKFLNPVCILKSYNSGYQAGFSASSSFELKTDHGTFSNIDAAFHSIKDQEDSRADVEIMKYLTRLKFQQYPELVPNLLSTGIRKIYDFSRYAFGENLVGICLTEIRQELFLQKYPSSHQLF